jgi:hypothetical protein
MLLCRIPLQPVFWVYTVSDNRAANLVLHPRGTVHGTKIRAQIACSESASCTMQALALIHLRQ